jgi:hypothetical protein
MWHILIFALKLFFGSVAGLILAGFLVATLRAILNHKKAAPWNPDDIPAAMAKAASEKWVHRSLAAFDIAVNVILLRGQQDETISTHSWRAAQLGKLWGRAMCWWLNLFQPNHGPLAACGDLVRAMTRVAVLKKALGIA